MDDVGSLVGPSIIATSPPRAHNDAAHRQIATARPDGPSAASRLQLGTFPVPVIVQKRIRVLPSG